MTNQICCCRRREIALYENLLVYLIGPPGVGKATVGRLLAKQLPARLVDNHHWLNPVLSLIEQDGVTPLPEHFWELAARSRRVVLDTIVELSPANWSFVFTHAAVGDGKAIDQEILLDIKGVARSRKAHLWAVQLTSSAEELARRVVSPERRDRMKEINPVAARRNAVQQPFNPGIDNTILIDTTMNSPHETMREVLLQLDASIRRSS